MPPANDRRRGWAGSLDRLATRLLVRPTTWAYALLIAVGVAIPLLLLHVAGSMNDQARVSSEGVAQTAERALADADRRTLYDYAHWNASYDALAGTVDQTFAKENLSAYLGQNFGLSGSILITDDNRIAFAWSSTGAPIAAGDANRIESLGSLLAAARTDTSGGAKQGYAVLDGKVMLATAARVQREDVEQATSGPILVFLRGMSESLLARIGSDYVLAGLRVADSAQPVAANEATLVLKDVEGHPVTTLAWNVDWPGTRMIWSFGVPVIGVLAALLVLTLFNLARIQHYARVISATNLTLSEREAEANAARARAEKADHAKTSFLANMSHELRTPLNAVIGFCELLETQLYGPLNQKQGEYLRDIKTSGHHLLGIINDILDTARLGAGQHKLNPERLVLASVVDDSLRFVKGRAEEGGISLVNGVTRDMPMLFADARALRQVLINLAGNAVKFTPQGGTVSVSAWIDTGGDYVLAIVDNGTGIPRETLARLFQPFQQGDNTLTRRHEGTGLGLTISRELMALHGGTLTIESEVGQGTRALARFPAGRVIHLGRGSIDAAALSDAANASSDADGGADGAASSAADDRLRHTG